MPRVKFGRGDRKKVRLVGRPCQPGSTDKASVKSDRGSSVDRPRFLPLRVKNPTTAEDVREAQQSVRFEVPGGQEFEILTPPAVARELDCTPGRVIQLIQEEKLRATALGRTWLIFRSDLDDYVFTKAKEIQRRYGAFLEYGGKSDRTEKTAKPKRRWKPKS